MCSLKSQFFLFYLLMSLSKLPERVSVVTLDLDMCSYPYNWMDDKVSLNKMISSIQFSSVTQLCPILCDPMNHSTPGLPVHHQLAESTQTHVH